MSIAFLELNIGRYLSEPNSPTSKVFIIYDLRKCLLYIYPRAKRKSRIRSRKAAGNR
jgi:hypothetical protein